MLPKITLPGVKRVLVIASGKGGVGKTTVTVNLALALHRSGAGVGIFDADVYGPNVPLMLGVHQRQRSQGFVPVVRSSSAVPYITPLDRFGLKLMSVGLLMAEDQVINPPADAAGQLVVQTLKDVVWVLTLLHKSPFVYSCPFVLSFVDLMPLLLPAMSP